MSALSDILKRRRKELGLTLAQIADAMGVAEATVQRWESGSIKSIRQEKIALLADVLNVKPAQLMGWNNHVYEYPDDENPYELELRDVFSTLDVDNQIFVKNWVSAFAVDPEKAKYSPDEQQLTEGERTLLNLFRKVPEDRQQMVIQMIQAALSNLK